MEVVRLGPYRLENRLGAGGMGVVYRAYDERLDRWVAIKLIPQDRNGDAYRARLRQEARATARLSHPAIVQVFDFIETGQGDGLVMELVEGRPLSHLVRHGPIDPAPGLGLAREIAGALAEAHAHGIVHRDLKTENVLVTPSGHAKILDFGIAKRLDHGDTSLTAEGAIVGTCRTMSPEQAQGREVDHRSDLFSFGTLLYELFTGQSPFQAATSLATLHRVCVHSQTPAKEANPQVPEALSKLIERLLEKHPEGRPASAGEVARVLERIAAGDFAETPGPPEPADTIAEPGIASSSAPRTTAERRLVTVACFGLAGTGEQPADPEDFLDELPALHRLVAEVVERFEGHLGSMRGQGFLAYFGYPRAHEDDARRAVRAALEIAERMGTPASGARRGKPGLRIGVHTGPMVLRGTRGTQDGLALGETPEIAAFLHSVAGLGAVVVSGATFRLIEGFFEGEDLGSVSPPGAGRPVAAWRVRSESGARTRIETAGSLTPLIAREQELRLLLDRWELAREGKGQAVLLSGEAGLGKSRLVWELKHRTAGESSGHWIEAFGSPFHQDSALEPIRQWLHRWMGGDAAEAPEERLARLEGALARHGLPLPAVLPFLAALTSLPAGERHPLPPLSPEVQRKKTLEAVLAWLLTAAERAPLLLVIEDMHWVDASTIELLGRLIEHISAAPILLLLTFRPELRLPWQERLAITRLGLSSLTRGQARLMVERLTEGKGLESSVREQIAGRTDGVPLFIEELTKMILESGRQPSGEIPATLEGWFRARLDRLDTAKQVAQLGSVLGREFSAELLQAAAPWSEALLERELERLVQAEILYRRGLPPHHRFLFKHALLQDVAYASLLRADRQRYHQRIAEVLERQFPALAEGQPEVLAHHYTGAGLAERAIPRWQQAGERAIQASAHQEAIGHLTRALNLLGELPETLERHRQEIALQLALGAAVGGQEGYTAPAVQRAYARARELCGKVGSTRQLYPVMRGLFLFYLIAGQTRTANELAPELLDLAEREKDPGLLLSSHQSMGFGLLLQGDVLRARHHLETALSFFDPTRPSSDVILAGVGDPVMECLGYLTWSLWYLGYPDQAVARGREALALGRRNDYLRARAHAGHFLGDVLASRGDLEELREVCRDAFPPADVEGLGEWPAVGAVFRGYAQARSGEVAAGIALTENGLAELRRKGARACVPHYLILLALSREAAGDLEEALAAIDEAFELTAGGEELALPELYRLRGELLRRRGAADEEVEDHFRRALDASRRQSARSLELRASSSLARLWAGQGRRAEARQLLAAIYGWFTEGFETRDLREARELLAQLG